MKKDDLVSRQAVVEMLERRIRNAREQEFRERKKDVSLSAIYTYVRKTITNIKDEIQSMPSAGGGE